MTDWFSEVTGSGSVMGPMPAGAKPAAPAAPAKTDWYQELTSATAPAATALGKGVVDDPSRAAGYGTQAVGSLPTDPMAAVRYFASQRFPDLPVDKAIERYGVKDGRLFYVDRDGTPYFEQTELRLPTSVENLNSTGKAIAGSAGPALPVIGGTVGGAATGGFFGGVPGAAAGGAAGDMIRQGAAAALTGEEKPLLNRVLQTGGAAVEQGAGQLVGLGIAKGAQAAGLARTPAFAIDDATDITNKARAVSLDPNDPIPLTPGEATGSRTLIRRQKILANTTEGEDTFGKFYQGRNEKVRDAVYKFLDDLSIEGDTAAGRRSAVTAAQDVVGQERQALQRQAKPLYDTARKVDNVDTKPVLDLIDDKLDVVPSRVASKLKEIRGDLFRTVKTTDPSGKVVESSAPDGRIAKLDEVKKTLDDMIRNANAETGIGASQKHHLEEVRALLVQQADAASPEYAQARGIYEAGMPAVTASEKGIVGDIAELEPTTNSALSASRILFSPQTSSPLDIRQAREAFKKAGKDAEWRTLVRAHLQDVFESIPESATEGTVTNLGGTFRKAVYGSPKKQFMLAEALRDVPDAGQNLGWLMEVLGATGRASKGESITAFAQAGQRQLAKEAASPLAGLVETVEIWRTPSRVARYINDIKEGKYAAKMAEILTSPDGIAKLKELRKFSPTSSAAMVGVGHLLTSGAAAAGGSIINPPRDRMPADAEPMTQDRQ